MQMVAHADAAVKHATFFLFLRLFILLIAETCITYGRNTPFHSKRGCVFLGQSLLASQHGLYENLARTAPV